jgi:transposase
LKSIDQFSDIYLYRFPVDMRKYRNGLCAIVQEKLERSVFARSLFVFTNKRGRIIRFIYWDDTGFAIWTKTLDRQKYRWPTQLFEGAALAVTSRQLEFILRGMDITSHKTLEYENMF